VEKRSIFDVVTVGDYHADLIHTWFRLVKDGMVKKDNENYFVDVGKFYVSFIMRNSRLPDYGDVMSWISNVVQ
jgi:hypothetical protein